MILEPTVQTRRQFLRSTALGSAVSWTVPAFLARTFAELETRAADSNTAVATGKDAPILVVLQMAGGNDGLNTVVPYADDFYHRARPTLRILPRDVLRLDEHCGFPPALSDLKALFDSGRLGIVHGVGYPNPNRSHFRSTEIWQTASDANKNEAHGWLGRYFDHACRGADPTVGVNIGRQMPQAFAAPRPVGVCLDNPGNYRFAATDAPGATEMNSTERFFRELNRPQTVELDALEMNSGASVAAVAGAAAGNVSPLDFLERTALEAQLSSDKIRGISRRAANRVEYPPSQIGNALRLVARLIGGGLPTRVYYVSQGGYDTHANQMPAHDRLLRELGGAVRAFADDLKALGQGDRVLLMTFSEFGRRVAQNANGGTDHGAAAPMFFIGGKVKPGFHGRAPSLAPQDLHQGDLRFTTDFRAIYAGVLEHWLRTPSAPVLGRQFVPVPVV